MRGNRIKQETINHPDSLSCTVRENECKKYTSWIGVYEKI